MRIIGPRRGVNIKEDCEKPLTEGSGGALCQLGSNSEITQEEWQVSVWQTPNNVHSQSLSNKNDLLLLKLMLVFIIYLCNYNTYLYRNQKGKILIYQLNSNYIFPNF